MYKDATELYLGMEDSVSRHMHRRKSDDVASPQTEDTSEAEPGQTFTLLHPRENVVGCRPVDLCWAVANVLHFFADTERAAPLRKYNRYADRFLTGDRWLGAYGAIAMPQVRRCIVKLAESRHTRRAVVSMGELVDEDINRPSCWSFLHFLYARSGLEMLVYQRSLSLSVMPYDAAVLCSLHAYVAERVWLPLGYMRWCVGSLHSASAGLSRSGTAQRIALPTGLLSEPSFCYGALEDPATLPSPYKEWML